MKLWSIYFTGLEQSQLFLVHDETKPEHILGDTGILPAHTPVQGPDNAAGKRTYTPGSVAFVNCAYIRAIEPVNPASYEVAK